MVKITKDEFNKLNQLDRIELMLKHNRINEKYKGSFCFWAIMITSFFIGFSFLIMITGYSAFGKEFLINIVYKFLFIGRILIWYLVISIFIDIIMSIKFSKEIKELTKEFFKIEPNKK